MVHKLAYSGLITRVLFITLTCLVMSFLVFGTKLYPLAGLVAVLLILQVIFLARSLNKTRRKVTYFFDAIKSEDTSLHFPDDIKNETEKTLNRSLNRVNNLIQQAKKELISQEKYYSYLIEEAETGLVTRDHEGNVLLSNGAAKSLLGLKRFSHIDQLNKVNEKMFLAFKSMKLGESRVVKFYNEKETVHLALKANSIKIQEQDLVLVTINNIRHELENQEIESWIRLIRVLTHEIMNSVTPITSMAETLSETYADHKKMSDVNLDSSIVQHTISSLDIIKQRGHGLMSFVDSYRKLTKLPVPKKTTFNAANFLESIRMLVSQEKNMNKVQFKLEVPDKNIDIRADQQQLTHVMINLIKNALDVLDDGKKGLVKIGALIKQNQTIISVSDNGPGIPPEVLEQIFIPFFTTKENGSGIGLSLSHHIIRMHGGKIEVNTGESGTTFFVFLK